MKSEPKTRADGVAAIIQKLPRPVNVVFILLSVAYVAMPWHFVPIIGQVDLAVVAWFAWQNYRALVRKPTVDPPPSSPGPLKEVYDVRPS